MDGKQAIWVTFDFPSGLPSQTKQENHESHRTSESPRPLKYLVSTNVVSTNVSTTSADPLCNWAL